MMNTQNTVFVRKYKSLFAATLLSSRREERNNVTILNPGIRSYSGMDFGEPTQSTFPFPSPL